MSWCSSRLSKTGQSRAGDSNTGDKKVCGLGIIGGMTEAATEAVLAPLQLTDEQLAVVRALYPDAFPAPLAEPSAPERVVVKPGRESRLEALLCQYKPFKEAAEQAAQRFRELREAVTAELESLYPDGHRPTDAFEIAATSMWPGMTLAYKKKTFLPSGKIREFLPEVYNAFVTTSTYSELRESARGRKQGRR